MLKIFDEVNCPGLLWDCSVQGGVEGECNRLFILQNMPHYSKLHLMTKSQNFHFQLKYHNVSVYTEHPVKEKIWYTLIIREDGESISSMMVSEEWPNFQIIFEYDDWLINILPRIYLMIKFYDYHFLLDTDYWFLLPSIVGEGWRKQNNQWDDSHEVWMSRRPRPLCSLESGVSSELWGFRRDPIFFILQNMPHYLRRHLKTKKQNFHFQLKYHNVSVYRTSHSDCLVLGCSFLECQEDWCQGISPGNWEAQIQNQVFWLAFSTVIKNDPVSMYAPLCSVTWIASTELYALILLLRKKIKYFLSVILREKFRSKYFSLHYWKLNIFYSYYVFKIKF